MTYTSEEMAAYITRYRQGRRRAAIELLGGACVSCGTTENLEFDHIDPATKVASIASMFTASKAKFAVEIAKCQLLCTACHLERSRSLGMLSAVPPWNKGLISAKHGTESRYKHGCRCEPCRDGKRKARARRETRGSVGDG